MKHLSTGTGVAVLGVCILAATVVATHRGGSEAFAQGTGTDRRIVAQGGYIAGSEHWGYRTWSDNTTEIKFLGLSRTRSLGNNEYLYSVEPQYGNGTYRGAWQVVDSGTSAFLPADVDHSTQVDAGDISAVLLDFGDRNDETPPPPIDCNINAPR